MAEWQETIGSSIVTGHVIDTPRGPQRINHVASHGVTAVKLYVDEGDPLVQDLDESIMIFR